LVANPANAICLGWEINNLYSQNIEVMTSIFWLFCSISSLYGRSQGQVLTGPPPVTQFVSATRSESEWGWQISLPRVFNNLYFRVFFKSRPSHLFEEDCLLVDHTHIYQTVFLNRATDWSFSIVITSRTDGLSIRLDFVTGSCRWITELLHRKHDEPFCGEKACEILLWSAISKCIQVKLDKHPEHSFLSSPRVMNINEMNNYIAIIFAK
jgi:hypothetical protein